ncbi:DUF84 family protein [Niallia sp. 01092]|uniref:DUF84 family protein n=1 Tax=unclassified Niallia TaxID=2837522 RepID=UPI003FD59EFC
MKICIGTKNPAKVSAVKEGFQSYEDTTFLALNISSGVREQPFSDEETIQGAINRAKGAVLEGNGDVGIGLEGGVHRTKDGLLLCNWGALVTKEGQSFIVGGARLPLPSELAEYLLAGEELGPVMDRYANKHNVRHHEGAIGILTNGKVSRTSMFLHVIHVLIGQYEYFKHKK